MPDIKPYHNDAVWPFVQAYWNIAAAKAGNILALNKGLAALYRAAAFFGTNKELFVASNGDYRGTAVNSDSQLWSAAGNAAMIFRIIMGMTFEPNGIRFSPVVPPSFTGEKTLTNLKYRDATLTVKVIGTGDRIKSFTVNGEKDDDYFLKGDVTGNVEVLITMADNTIKPQDINSQPQACMPATPIVDWVDNKGEIRNYSPGISYGLTVNSTFLDQITTPVATFIPDDNYSLMDIVPVLKETWSGFSCKPYEYIPAGSLTVVNADKIGKTGTSFIKDKDKASRFIELSPQKNTDVTFRVNVDTGGDYLLDVRYANGEGPINTENKCAIRMLYINGQEAGAIVMPQRGIDEWLSTGFSNMLRIKLKEGINELSIRHEIDNMNGKVNTALLQYVRIIKQ